MTLAKPAFMGSKVQYSDLIFVPLAFLFLFRVFLGKAKSAGLRLLLPVTPLVLVCFLSLLRSFDPRASLPDFIGLVYLVLLYFVLVSLLGGALKFRRVATLQAMLTCFVSLSGIFFWVLYKFFGAGWVSRFLFIGRDKSALIQSVRVSSYLALPEMFTNFLLLGLACLFTLAGVLTGMSRKLVFYGIVLTVVSAFLALSRSLAGVMLFLALASFTLKYKGSAVMRYLCAGAFISLLLFAVFTSVFVVYPVSFSKGPAGTGFVPNFNSNLDIRVDLAKAALGFGAAHPFAGIGLGSFTGQMQLDPHSLYFGAIAETGWLGLAAMLFFFAMYLYGIKRVERLTAGNEFIKYAGIFFPAAIYGYLLNGLFVDVLSMRSLWVCLALGAAAARLRQQKDKEEQSR